MAANLYLNNILDIDMKKIICLASVMSLFGCAQTTSDYYYASLEGISDIEITSVGKVRLENLKGNTEIPTSYSLKREGYNLRFFIGDNSYYPHFKIVVESSSSASLSLNPRRNKETVSKEGVICASYYTDNQNPSKLDFGWSSGCLEDDIPNLISFDVIDANGGVVAKENLPFKLKKDGKYTLLDAI